MPEPPSPPTADRAPSSGERRVVRSVLCPHCGCGCDDLDLVVAGNRVVEAAHACAPGREALLRPLDETAPEALVDGRAAEREEALDVAAGLLRDARAPLVWGLLRASCEAQRQAVAIADALRAVIDPAAGPNHPAAVASFQEWGEVSATVGEVRLQRGLVVLWLCEPERTHPRLLGRWGVSADDARLLRLVSSESAAGDGAWSVPAGRQVDLLWTLRELARHGPDANPAEQAGGVAGTGSEHPEPNGHGGATGGRASRGSAKSDRSAAGDPVRDLAHRLLERLRAAPYVLFVFDAPAATPLHQHALRATAAALNAVTRFRLFPLRGPGNRVGAEAVLTWQTGFPVAVSFASGAPVSRGEEAAAARLLERDAVDAALVIGASPDDVPAAPVFRRLADVPRVVLDSAPNVLAGAARVALRSAPFAIASGGTVFRSDGIALPLRPALRSRYPSDEEWLRRLASRLAGAPRDRRSGSDA